MKRQPAADPFTPAITPVQPLPKGHPLAEKLAHWEQLRQQLTELVAQLEYLKLMARLDERRQAGSSGA